MAPLTLAPLTVCGTTYYMAPLAIWHYYGATYYTRRALLLPPVAPRAVVGPRPTGQRCRAPTHSAGGGDIGQPALRYSHPWRSLWRSHRRGYRRYMLVQKANPNPSPGLTLTLTLTLTTGMLVQKGLALALSVSRAADGTNTKARSAVQAANY